MCEVEEVENVWGGESGECEVESPCVGVEGEEFLCGGGGGGVSMCGGKEVDFLWGGGEFGMRVRVKARGVVCTEGLWV